MKPSLFISLVVGVLAGSVCLAEEPVVAVKQAKPELPPGWTVPVKAQPSGAKEILAQVEVKPENKNRRLEYLQELQRRIDAEKALLAAERAAQLRALEIQAQEDAAFQARVDARIAEQAREKAAKEHQAKMEAMEYEKLQTLRDIEAELSRLRRQGR